MTVLGIDPGLSGGIGVLYDAQDAAAVKTPTIWVPVKGRKRKRRREYDLGAMAWTLVNAGPAAPPIVAVVEAVHAMPGQGVSSTFAFGRGLGLWEGMLTAMSIPIIMVPPQRWKKALGLTADKKEAIERAKLLWPHLGLRADGPAEALLLALYGRDHVLRDGPVPEAAIVTTKIR